MGVVKLGLAVVMLLAAAALAGSGAQPSDAGPAQQPATSAPQAPGGRGQPGAQPPGGRGGRGGRGPVPVMTMSSSSWPDGGLIPLKHTQAGDELSPPFSWSRVPEGVESFVLIAHDVDAVVGGGTDAVLHWLVWNIPGTARSLPEAVPHGPQLDDGTRQISVSGPYYRGPGAPATGPPHHYVFELYALDTLLELPPEGLSPAQTRAAVLAAMAGRVRGKAAYVGLFRRPS